MDANVKIPNEGTNNNVVAGSDAGMLAEIESLKATLLEQQKLASIGLLTAGILHEIKNPLNFVINFAKLSGELIDELEDLIDEMRGTLGEDKASDLEDIGDSLKANIAKITDNSQRAMRLISSMLNQSREEYSVQFEETDVNQLVDEFTKLAYQGMRGQNSDFNMAIETDYDPTLGKVRVDAHDLSRVILNIVSNACYAVNQKKMLSNGQYKPEVKLTTSKSESDLFIRIRDNGMGIPDSIQEKIFKPFFTTKPSGEGTGLGLYMSYDIITKVHKGKLEVHSVPNEFTEFIITIPLT